MKPVVLASLLALSVVVVAALAGCGQKGPLYLPGQNPNPPKSLLDESPDESSSEASTPADHNEADPQQMSVPDHANKAQ